MQKWKGKRDRERIKTKGKNEAKEEIVEGKMDMFFGKVKIKPEKVLRLILKMN